MEAKELKRNANLGFLATLATGLPLGYVTQSGNSCFQRKHEKPYGNRYFFGNSCFQMCSPAQGLSARFSRRKACRGRFGESGQGPLPLSESHLRVGVKEGLYLDAPVGLSSCILCTAMLIVRGKVIPCYDPRLLAGGEIVVTKDFAPLFARRCRSRGLGRGLRLRLGLPAGRDAVMPP